MSGGLESAYVFDADPSYCKNVHVLKWWTAAHDKIIAERIGVDQWNWPWGVTEAIVAATPKATISEWRRRDPVCRRFVWYNVLMYFAISRANAIGLTKMIRKPKIRKCPLCGKSFREDSLPGTLVDRLGIDQLDFCAPCLRDAPFFREGSGTMSGARIQTS